MPSASAPKTMNNRPAKKSLPSRTLPTSRSPVISFLCAVLFHTRNPTAANAVSATIRHANGATAACRYSPLSFAQPYGHSVFAAFGSAPLCVACRIWARPSRSSANGPISSRTTKSWNSCRPAFSPGSHGWTAHFRIQRSMLGPADGVPLRDQHLSRDRNILACPARRAHPFRRRGLWLAAATAFCSLSMPPINRRSRPSSTSCGVKITRS